MNWGTAGGAIAVGGGLATANAFRFKQGRDRADRRLKSKDEQSRRGHFRGSADVDLGGGPPGQDQDL